MCRNEIRLVREPLEGSGRKICSHLFRKMDRKKPHTHTHTHITRAGHAMCVTSAFFLSFPSRQPQPASSIIGFEVFERWRVKRVLVVFRQKTVGPSINP